MINPFLTQLDGLHRLCINEGRYLLIELPMIDLPQFTEEVIHNLQVKGIVPILAHPERNYRIANNPDLLNPLIELGALVQINTGSITGLFGKKIRRCAKTLFKNNMAHLIGTDAHSAVKRPPEMRKSAQILERWVGQQRAETILVENPRAIVNNIILEVIN